MSQPSITAFFDEPTNTVSYLVACKTTKDAVVIDPVLDFDMASGEAGTRSADAILAVAAEQGLRLVMVVETHAHADDLSAAPYLKARTGALIGIGEHIRDVQEIFRPVFCLDDLKTNDSDFDRLFRNGEVFAIGDLQVKVMHTPGHTPADVSYCIGDAVFVGDTLFMPDYGTARADFPGGCARQLYRSIKQLVALPRETRLFMCHDYKAPGRDEYAWETTVGAQINTNVHIGAGQTEDAFVAMREARDATLSTPRLLLPSIQVNIRAGRFPEAQANGVQYLMIPVTAKAGAVA
jgi:glyoxylase-like metal-dependent hydrolase (beta-lactamase superfamily II)